MVKDLSFKAKTRKVGNGMVVSVPMAFFTHDLLKEGKTYVFVVNEVQNGTNE